MLDSPTFSIEFAKYTMSVATMLTGVAPHRIRRFEEFGLFAPSRTQARQRLFSDRNIALIIEIATLEEQGVNLPGVRVILSLKQVVK